MVYDPKANPKIDWEYLGEDFRPEMHVEKMRSAWRTPEREMAELQWSTNINWFLGNPYVRFVPGTQRLEWIKPELRDEYFHINVINPRVMTLVGNELYTPKFEARPQASPAIEDIMRARAANDVANHAVAASGLGNDMAETHIHKHVFGIHWQEVAWNPEDGPLKPVYGNIPCPTCQGLGAIPDQVTAAGMAPCFQCGAQGAVVDPTQPPPPPGHINSVIDEAPDGDVEVISRPAWEVLFDPRRLNPFKARGLMHDCVEDKSVAFELYCEGTGVRPDDLVTAGPETGVMDRTMLAKTPAINSVPIFQDDTVKVCRFFSHKTTKHPRGLYLVMVGGVCVQARALYDVYPHRRIPFVPVRCYAVPMKAYPVSSVDNMMPDAIFINDTLTKIYQRAQQSVQMRMIAARGSAVDLSDVQGLLEYDHDVRRPAPQPYNDSGSSPDAANIVDRLVAHLDQASFSNDALRGEIQGSNDNARFSALREQRAMNPLRAMVEDNSRSFALVGKLLFETIKCFYQPGRVIRSVFGSRGHAKFFAFQTENMGSCDDFEIMSTRDVGRSLASRREELYEAVKAGVFPQGDPAIKKLSEFAVEASQFDDQHTHESAAMMENERQRAGGQLDPASQFENHPVHIETHTPFLAELRMTFGAMDPRAQAMEQHMLQHLQWQSQEAAAEQQRQMAAAAQYGMANAQDPNAQPAAAQDAAAAAGPQTPAALAASPVPGGEPGPPESQPALAMVDAANQHLGVTQ